jgi:hypothetical protein
MAIVTNTFRTVEAKGIREDLADVIANISPEDTPFQSNIGRGKVSNTLYEWQTDELAGVDLDNNVTEGDDVGTFDEVTPTVRLQNYCQISRKTVVIANTMEAVTKAGRRSELAYQLAKKGAELKRDIEGIALSNQAASSSAGLRKTGSLLAFLKTNISKASDGVDPVYTTIPDDVRTNGTRRDFTEAMLKDVIQQCWTEGANPKILMVGPSNKQTVSAFPGIAQQRYNASGASPTTIVAAADVYVSDFGNLSVVPNRFMRAGDAFVLDPEYAEIVYLRPFKQEKLAKTGDAEKRMMIVEWGLKVKQEKAHGLITDLEPSMCLSTTDSCSASGTTSV